MMMIKVWASVVLLCTLFAVSSASRCLLISNATSCAQSSSNGERCVWCVWSEGLVPSVCLSTSESRNLPPAVVCSNPAALAALPAKELGAEPAAVVKTDKVTWCTQVGNARDCANSVELSGSQCVWCSSSIVPSTCLNALTAASLPTYIYTCNATYTYRSTIKAYRPRIALPIGYYKSGGDAITQIFMGVAEGLSTGLLGDLAACIKDAYAVYDDFRDFTTHLHADLSDVKLALGDLASGLKSFDSALIDCHVAEICERVASFVGKVDSVIGDIVIATEIVINGINIYEDLSDAVTAWNTGDYIQCGYHLADAIARVV